MKARKILLVLFVVFALFDIFLSLYGFYVNKHSEMEMNALFVITKSVWPALVANLIFVLVLFFFYTKTQPPIWNYGLTCSVVFNCVNRVPSIINAIKYIMHPVPAQAFAQVSDAQKVVAYTGWVWVAHFLPIIVFLVVYFIFQIDYVIKPKEVV